MSFLLDTDIWSAHLKGSQVVTSKLLQYSGRLYISAITLAELTTWARRAKAPPRRWQMVADFLNDVTVLDVTTEIASKFGEVRAALLDAGLPAPDMDLVIATTALVHNLTLVTHNTRDFLNVAGLSLCDWLDA